MPRTPPGTSRAARPRRFGAGGPTLAEVGEESLLEQLIRLAAPAPGVRRTPAGDDAAVWRPPAQRDLAISVDVVVEDVDFRRGWIAPRQLGRRAYAVAVSDLAAMGAQPLHCVVTLCARGDEQVEDILEIQRGLCEGAAASGAAVIGGDVSATAGPLVIDVCVTGSLPRDQALRRSGGRPGDALLVTGVLGRGAAGLRLLEEGRRPRRPVEHAWIAAQLAPSPRLEEGRALLAAGVSCAGDISDGLVIDASRTARAGGCAAELWVDSLPVDAELARRFGPRWLDVASGGEDFELLCAVPEAAVGSLLERWPAGLEPLTQVGVLGAGSGLHLLDRRGGSEVAPPRPLSAHFS